MRTFAFFASYLALPLFGAPAAFHPEVARLSLAARAAAAFAAGAVLLTFEATLFSIFRFRWSVPALALPLLALSAVGSAAWARRPRIPPLPGSSSRGVRIAAAAAIVLAAAHLTVWLVSSRGTSADYVFFWGVKGVRFAEARGIDARLLATTWFSHATPDYPPLVPILYAWGVLVSGDLPWRRAPALAAVWWAAALPIVRDLLRRRVPADAGDSATAFWAVALAASLAQSFSGGNAEAPLLFFETVAVAALITETEGAANPRLLAGIALFGATLTKVEGLVASLLLVAGALLRDLIVGRPGAVRRAAILVASPLGAVATWFAFQALSGLTVGYSSHGSLWRIYSNYAGPITREMLRNLAAGTFGLSWALALVFLVAGRRNVRAVLPALFLSVGLLFFFAFDYLHDTTDPTLRIGWTLPRVSQPALSALILAAGVAASAGAVRDETRARRSGRSTRPATGDLVESPR